MSIKIAITEENRCPKCDGEGRIYQPFKKQLTGDESLMVACPQCNGDGTVVESREITLDELKEMLGLEL